jgi:hypothetical protein
MSKSHVVQLLECDPDLAEGLPEGERALATQALPVRVASLKKGPWHPDSKPPEPGHLGYLIVKGLLVRRIEVAQWPWAGFPLYMRASAEPASTASDASRPSASAPPTTSRTNIPASLERLAATACMGEQRRIGVRCEGV